MTRPADSAAQLSLSIDGSIAWLTAGNAGRMNALTASMWAAIPSHIAAADKNPDVRIIVVRGAGTKAFSAGADISEFESARTGDTAAQYDALNHAAFEALSTCKKPTLAMIHGFCLGGGLAIAACCDMRFADEASQFAIPAAKLGLGYNPRWIRPLLALAKPAHVKELLFTGRRFSSAEAWAMGLVNRVCETAALEGEVRAIAAQISSNAPLTVAAAKLAIDELTARPEHPDSDKLDKAVKACFDSDDYIEGRRAFLEKRPPQFKGR